MKRPHLDRIVIYIRAVFVPIGRVARQSQVSAIWADRNSRYGLQWNRLFLNSRNRCSLRYRQTGTQNIEDYPKASGVDTTVHLIYFYHLNAGRDQRTDGKSSKPAIGPVETTKINSQPVLCAACAPTKSWLVGLPDISNNVGPVKLFSTTLLRSLPRV